MIFKQVEAIKDGRKTQTRRVVKEGERAICDPGAWRIVSVLSAGKRLKYAVGQTYAIVPKRGAKAVGRIHLLSIRKLPLQAITEADAQAEGVGSVEEYRALWESINTAKGTRWEDNPSVWVYEFKEAE